METSIPQTRQTKPRAVRRFGRWLFSWRTLRRVLLTFASLMTFVALLYTEENRRGQRAWKACERELEAKGEVLAWAACIPPPVPDEQNVFKAPKIAEWFIRTTFYTDSGIRTNGYILVSRPNELTELLSPAKLSVFQNQQPANSSNLQVAELVVASDPSHSLADKTNVLWHFDDPSARETVGDLIRKTIGASLTGPMQHTLVARPLTQLRPLRIRFQAEKVPSRGELSAWLQTNSVAHAVGSLQIEPGSTPDSFLVMLKPAPVVSAAEYLASSDHFETEFDLMREALKRPYVRIDSDSQRPYMSASPHFLSIRLAAQTLAQRAQCHLLLGQPVQALKDLTLLHDMRRLLSGKPLMLVDAMIDVAVAGLYVRVVSEGFELHTWSEPELADLQRQLSDVNLQPLLLEGLRTERAAFCHTLENSAPSEAAYFFADRPLWQRLRDPLYWFFTLAPRGWIYQNMNTHSIMGQKAIESMSSRKGALTPHEVDNAYREIEVEYGPSKLSPFSFLGFQTFPNYHKSLQVLARNQTLANQALIVCALERFHLAHGSYPETLDALVPNFAKKLPSDIIKGQPLHYHRTTDGQFVLYSIGWNESDDGGQVVLSRDGRIDPLRGDWVWQTPIRF
jgi:hypothetical protein